MERFACQPICRNRYNDLLNPLRNTLVFSAKRTDIDRLVTFDEYLLLNCRSSMWAFMPSHSPRLTNARRVDIAGQLIFSTGCTHRSKKTLSTGATTCVPLGSPQTYYLIYVELRHRLKLDVKHVLAIVLVFIELALIPYLRLVHEPSL